TRMNLEMALTDEMIANTLKIKPHDACLVPERREELTTEGGLDVVRYFDRVKDTTRVLTEAGIRVSLFIDADIEQIDAAVAAGAPVIEIHTGRYAEAETGEALGRELERIREAVAYGTQSGLRVNAGHG